MINLSNIYKFIVIVIGCMLFACVSPANRTGRVADNRLKAESKFDPLGEEQDKAVITGKHASRILTETAVDTVSSAIDNPEQGADANGDTNTELFRVQIFASKSVEEANRYAASIKELFPEGIFVEYQQPYYKVRVGEFHRAADGESFLDHVKQLGFENAWLIRVIK